MGDYFWDQDESRSQLMLQSDDAGAQSRPLFQNNVDCAFNQWNAIHWPSSVAVQNDNDSFDNQYGYNANLLLDESITSSSQGFSPSSLVELDVFSVAARRELASPQVLPIAPDSLIQPSDEIHEPTLTNTIIGFEGHHVPYHSNPGFSNSQSQLTLELNQATMNFPIPSQYVMMPVLDTLAVNPFELQAYSTAIGANLVDMLPLKVTTSKVDHKSSSQGMQENTSPRAELSKRNLGLSCDWPGNKCKRTFKRFFELERHKRTQHERKQSYPCPVLSCGRQTTRPFFRHDKLKEHIRTVHSEEDSFACPAAGCKFYLTLDLLAIHISKHTVEDATFGRAAFKLMPWLWQVKFGLNNSGRHRVCPLDICHEILEGPRALRSHLTGHSRQGRISEHAAIVAAGYDPDTLHVICPMCDLRLASHDLFFSHMYASHLFTDAVHSELWLSRLIDNKGHCSSSQDLSPFSGKWTINTKMLIGTLECPACNFEIPREPLCTYAVHHHLRFLTPLETLHPYRRQILKIWPGFGEHVVFDDVYPAQPEEHETLA